MASYGFIAKIGADTSGLTASLKEIDNESKKLNSELKSVNNALKLNPESAVLAAQKMEVLSSSADAAERKLALLKSKQDEMAQALNRGDITGEQYREYERAVESCEGKLNGLRAQMDALKNPVKEVGEEIKDNASEMKKAAEKTDDYSQALRDLNSSAKKVKDDISDIAKLAGRATAVVGAAATKGVKEVIEVGSGFEKSMSNVQALSGAVGDDLIALTEAAEKMGKTTSKTASESADALGYMALAGWDTEEMLAGLEPILRLSEAGGIDLAKASDMVTDSMSSLGIEVNDLDSFVSKLAETSKDSNTSVAQLGEGILTVGGTAKTLKGGIDELNTMLGLIADNGVKGAEGGTALRNVILSLSTPTDKAKEAMEKLNVEAFDSEDNFRELSDIFADFNSALEPLSQKERTQFLNDIFNKVDLKTVNALLGTSSERFEELRSNIENCDGAADKMAKTMQDNLIGDFTQFQSALQGVGIDIYKEFAEPMRDAMQDATRQIGGLSDSITAGDLSGVVQRLAKEFGELLKKGMAFAANEGIPKLIKWLDWITQHGDEVTAIIKAIGAGWAAWKISTLAGDVAKLATDLGKYVSAAQSAATATEAMTAATSAGSGAFLGFAGAAIALSAALATLAASEIDSAAARLRNATALDEESQKLYDQARASDELREKIQKNNAEADSLAETEKRLWDRIKGLVDEEGRATGSTDELKEAVSRLNTLAGTNIEVVDGQIVKYGELERSIENVIAAQRKQAKLDYMADDYKEAAAKIDDVTAALDEASTKELAARTRYFKLDEEYNQAVERGYVLNGSFEELLEQRQKAQDEWTESIVDKNSAKTIYDNYNGVLEAYEAIEREMEESQRKTLDVEESTAEAANNGEQVGTAFGEGMAEGLEESEEECKKRIKAAVRDLEIEQSENGYDSSWLLDREEELLDTIKDKESDTYKDLYKDILDDRAKLKKERKKTAEENAKEARDEAKKELKEAEDDAKKQFDTIFDNLKNEKISREEFNREYLDLVEQWAEKNIDIHEYTSDKIADYDEKTRQNSIDAWEKASKAISERISKNYEDVEKSYQNARNSYLKSADYIDKKVTDTSGQERYVLTDFKKQNADLRKYMDDLEKLKETGISEEHLERIMDMSYDSGERQGYIRELLRMSETSRKAYYKDVEDFYSTVNEAARQDVEDQLLDADQAAADGISEIFSSMPDDAYEKGAETATSYINGIIDTMKSAKNLRIEGADFEMVTNSAGGSQVGGSPATAQNGAGMKDIVINIDGREMIRLSMDKYIRDVNNSGGMIGG